MPRRRSPRTRGLPAGTYAIRNTRSAVEPVLSFGTNRALRQKVWQAFVNRGDNGNANDTNALIAKIVKLRADRAHLLGFKTHADLADAGHDGQDPGAGDGPDDARLAGGGEAGQRGSRRHEAVRGQGRRRDDRAVGLSLSTGEGAQGEVRPQRGRDQALFRAVEHGQRHVLVGRAALRPEVQGEYRHGAGVAVRTSAPSR